MKRIIVIGAGISGLTAAIYAQRSGFDVTLCEQHHGAGGMCTSWKRKGYLFEGGIHWMTGSSPHKGLFKVWKETGALNDNVKVFLSDPFYAVDHDGQIIYLYRNIEKTAEQLFAISPKDEKRIRRLVCDVKAFSRVQMPVFDIRGINTENPKHMTIGTLFKILPIVPLMGRLNKTTIRNYAGQFEHPGIQRLFRFMPDEHSAVSLIFTLATLNIGDGGYPEGGSLAMTARMVKTFEDLGGKLMLNTEVKKVNIKNGAASGVTLENGTLAADAVIVTQETIAALKQLFDIPPDEPWLAHLRENIKPSVCTYISVGIRAPIIQTPVPAWKLEEPISYAGRTETELFFYNNTGFDGYAPKGCTTLTTMLMGDTYDFWKKAKEEGRYEQEKNRLASQISKAICRKYPQAQDNIEIVEIATPLTYERYTGAYHGSWMSIVGAGEKMKAYPGFLKKISGLYFAGHRLTLPGGLPVALTSGRKAAQMVCRQFNVMFR